MWSLGWVGKPEKAGQEFYSQGELCMSRPYDTRKLGMFLKKNILKGGQWAREWWVRRGLSGGDSRDICRTRARQSLVDPCSEWLYNAKMFSRQQCHGWKLGSGAESWLIGHSKPSSKPQSLAPWRMGPAWGQCCKFTELMAKAVSPSPSPPLRPPILLWQRTHVLSRLSLRSSSLIAPLSVTMFLLLIRPSPPRTFSLFINLRLTD